MLFDYDASHSFIAASVVIELGLEVETLEEPLYVSSPLGIRVGIGMICKGPTPWPTPTRGGPTHRLSP